ISKDLSFPLIVKSLEEEASLGISQASVVRSPAKLEERVAFVHEHIGDAIAEEYVEGRELTVSILGNRRLTVFPPWELSFRNLPKSNEPIATEKVKWDLAYQKKLGVDTGPADLSSELQRRISGTARRLYRAFGLSGYARADLRLTPEGRVYVIEVNATPDISLDEDFALSAAHAGMDYAVLVQRILNLARRYQPDWKRANA
ncbi:MAG: ATP-grasp domain-containing protein, partial [Myxococcales bacterium]|nr:ATP-grasp domain-containing protein [Myxococcales bacterium]